MLPRKSTEPYVFLMPNSPITIRLPHSPGYAAWSHGWAYLAPFSEDGEFLGWAVDLPKGGPRHLAIRWSDTTETIQIRIPGRIIGEVDREFIRKRIRWMFRADEDFKDFWKGITSQVLHDPAYKPPMFAWRPGG